MRQTEAEGRRKDSILGAVQEKCQLPETEWRKVEDKEDRVM